MSGSALRPRMFAAHRASTRRALADEHAGTPAYHPLGWNRSDLSNSG